MINRVILVGRLTKDPELRYTPTGIPMARFTLAINRAFSNQAGEREADFVQCLAWRKQAENLANYMRKGNLIGIDGRIQTGSFDGQDGKKVYTTDVIADSIQFLEPRNARTTQQNELPSYNNQPDYSVNQQNSYSTQQSSYSSQNSQNQQSYTRVDENPFTSSKSPIEVSDDDLPF